MLRFLTNGTFRQGQLEELINAAHHFTLLVSISVHFEYVKLNNLVEMVEKYANKTNLEFGIMLHPEYFEKVKETVDKLTELRSKYPFHLLINMLQEPPKFGTLDSRYTAEHFDWADSARERFDEIADGGPSVAHDRRTEVGRTGFFADRRDGDRVIHEEYSDLSELKQKTDANFSGMYCSAGTLVMSIYPNGNTKGAICRPVPVVCNIFEENPFERDDWMRAVPCIRNWCRDVKNHRTAKFYSKEEAELYIDECKTKQRRFLEEYDLQKS